MRARLSPDPSHFSHKHSLQPAPRTLPPPLPMSAHGVSPSSTPLTKTARHLHPHSAGDGQDRDGASDGLPQATGLLLLCIYDIQRSPATMRFDTLLVPSRALGLLSSHARACVAVPVFNVCFPQQLYVFEFVFRWIGLRSWFIGFLSRSIGLRIGAQTYL